MGALFRPAVLGTVVSLLALSATLAQKHADPQPPSTTIPLSTIPRVARPPRIEDFLDGRPREAELAVRDFRQNIPGDGDQASESTTAYLSYDQRNLYVVFESKDSSGAVRAHLSKREDLDQDDGVGVFLDTFHDKHRAYYFFSNPVGIQQDAIYTEGQGYDYSFDTVWSTEGRLTNDGYVVWFSIPFKSLRFSHDPEQTWGVALFRTILRKSEYDYWPYVTQRVQGLAQQFAPVNGLEHVSPGRNIQFIPYGLLAGNHFLNQPTDGAAPAYKNVFEHRAGLDAKFVANDSLTFDVTLNPDFSQVESDDPQVTVNQRFAVFFPEKRPFFIENAGFFMTPVNLFFSRQIMNPQFGARMTGKVGQWTIGALTIDDRQPGQNQPSSSPFDTRAVDGVVRIAREFGKQSYIGAFASTRDFADTSNRVVSLDARIKLSKNWVSDFQATHSWTRQDNRLPQPCQNFEFPPGAGPAVNASSQQGNSLYADLSYTGRHFVMTNTYSDYSPGFCTELGFVPRVDIRQETSTAGYYWRPIKSKIVDFGPSVAETLDWDHNQVLQDWAVAAGFQIDWTRQTTLSFSRGEAYELFANIPFRKHSTAIQFTSAPYKWLSFMGRYTTGTGENFFPASGLAPFLGNVNRVNLGFTVRPSARFRVDETAIYYRLGTRESSTPAGFDPGHPIFNNYLLRTKVNYQFTRELSLRMILDYDVTLANPQLLDLQRNLGSFDGGPIEPPKKFTPDFLLTYLVHPGTALYIGYNNSFSNLRLDDTTTPPQVFLQRSPTNTSGRLFFVKLSYLFRF
ncbi:MAG TPA: DUF5916 domain-containing protein [Candidatus Acidoferrum sp.]|nr:DUF5916 domain-containing protein [Candidatus Acidoferrum sp.]